MAESPAPARRDGTSTPVRPAVPGPPAAGPPESRRLVVVGAGPKALFALEALTARLREREHGPRLAVTVIDPHAQPGTGAAYDPAQPEHLRLNVSARILDAPRTGDMPSFVQWVRTVRPDLAEDPFPPRAVVGTYLRERWAAMRGALERVATCRHLRGQVVSLERAGTCWRVRYSAPGAGPAAVGPVVVGPVDEVLLATGHARGHAGALAASWDGPMPLQPAVLPVTRWLGPERVPPGSRVAMRGAALTFLDAALTLTEGRGGCFELAEGCDGADRHRRAPEEPATILPTARHGLLLDAKPDPAVPPPPQLEQAVAEGRRQLAAAQDGRGALTLQTALAVVATTAVRTLDGGDAARGVAGGAGPEEDPLRRAVEHTLTTGAEPDLPPGPGRAEQALRRSVAVARGLRPPGPAWALGRSWALLYPQLTAALRGNDEAEEQWRRFRDAAQVLERFAFGPPLVSARKLLAMVDSGAVDLSWLDAGTTITPRGPRDLPAGSPEPAVVLDAVLTPPGIRGITDPLLRRLHGTGVLSLRPGRRGAVVDPDGTAITAQGTRAEGLAVIGRATEDHVIGHDTLNRHLHTEIEHWADRLARRSAGGDGTPRPARDRQAAHAAGPKDETP
ncbi:FAD/NAD(P)-binding protein [Brachybacterium sp. YJGR34]|uniref:FAD/NAD(P)-binding protein n=1 Tax=Brachybacterium sp. YJGR34 TaxID=2059911 RepID=UPI00130028DE|nr:FAD/NAD(P)-binding domain-containing protein [Brachybacterium sp. YJGR34]